jgi:hypothetical protein
VGEVPVQLIVSAIQDEKSADGEEATQGEEPE